MSKCVRVLLSGLVAALPLFIVSTSSSLAGDVIVLAQAEKAHTGTGKINSIDAKNGKANIHHDPIASLKWPAMAMDFQVQDKEGLAKLKPGDQVEFKFEMPRRGQYVITEIKPR